MTDSPLAVRRSWIAEAMLALVPMELRPFVVRAKVEDQWFEFPDTRRVANEDEPPGSRDMVPLGVSAPGQADRTLEIMPGQHPLRPVIREVETGRVVAGSGRYPNANNPAAVGIASAMKRSKSFREALEKLIPYEDADARITLERLVDDAVDAAEGSPQTVKCPHCQRDGVVAFKKDGNLLFKLIELLVGSAPKTLEVKGNFEVQLLEAMNRREAVPVISMTKEEWEARTARLLEKGILKEEWLEGEYKELDPAEKPKLTE